MEVINQDKISSIKHLLRKNQPPVNTFEEPEDQPPKFQYLEHSNPDIQEHEEQQPPKKKRGRPPKTSQKDRNDQSFRSFLSSKSKNNKPLQIEVDCDQEEPNSVNLTVKKRGRPRKNADQEQAVTEVPRKKGRGRPKKNLFTTSRVNPVNTGSRAAEPVARANELKETVREGKPQSSVRKEIDLEERVREKKKKQREATPISQQFREMIQAEKREELKVLEIKERKGEVAYLIQEGENIRWVSSEELTEHRLKQVVRFYERRTLNEHNLKHDHFCNGPVFIRRE